MRNPRVADRVNQRKPAKNCLTRRTSFSWTNQPWTSAVWRIRTPLRSRKRRHICVDSSPKHSKSRTSSVVQRYYIERAFFDTGYGVKPSQSSSELIITRRKGNPTKWANLLLGTAPGVVEIMAYYPINGQLERAIIMPQTIMDSKGVEVNPDFLATYIIHAFDFKHRQDSSVQTPRLPPDDTTNGINDGSRNPFWSFHCSPRPRTRNVDCDA